MKRVALTTSLLSSVALAGCFYVDPINQRPALDIRPDTSDPVYRKSTVLLHGIAADPEKHEVSFAWQVFLCSDATALDGCDPEPYYTATTPDAMFLVPSLRADPDGAGPAAAPPNLALRVVLDGRDDRGAAARPGQELIMPVLNHPPDLELRKVATHGAVVDTSIDVFAKFGDVDDLPANVTLEWAALSPAMMSVPLVDISVPQEPDDPDHAQAGKRFTPAMTGAWDIRVIATDMVGARLEQHLPLTVLEDAPPCLDTLLPIAPTGGALYPLTEQTLFQVLVVRDDLDVYPPIPSDPVLRITRFEWSMKLGAGPRQPLPTTSNSVAVDPASYAPGTTFELRVQIYDRKNVPITCADGDQTCAVVGSNPDCIQRQTWRVEVR